MFSHDHLDSFNVLRDILFHEPIMTNFIVGSVTSYGGKFPNFNVIYLDPETMLPLDYEVHYFNITNANKYDKP